MKNLILILLVFVFGCSFEPAHEFVISPDFSLEDQEAIISAVDEWCAVADVCIPVSVGDNANILLIDNDCERYGYTKVSRTGQPVIRLCDITNEVEEVSLRTVVLHEIGHSIVPRRADHTDTGVMSSPWDGTEHLTEDDIEYIGH